MNRVIQNAVKITEDGVVTYLRSSHRHDYVVHTFKNGGYYALDGGLDYCRVGQSNIPHNVTIESFSLVDIDDFTTIADKLLWGTRGPSGGDKIKIVPFKELTLDHLQAILDYNDKLTTKLNDIQVDVIIHWINEKITN